MIIAIIIFTILQVISSVLIGWHVLIAFLGTIQLIRKKEPRGDSQPMNRFAVIVCARNEEKVLTHLLKSLKDQDYPKKKWHVYLLADHCTDGTVRVAKKYPFVTVYERTDGPQSGKGAVLMWGLAKILREKKDTFDALMIFDADNVAKSDFMSRMNEHLNKGNQVVQGNRISGEPYRTFVTKWYACYWPLYTMLYSYPRENLHLSCFLTGTGFAIKKELLETYGWNTNTITEDVEFAFQQCLRHDRTAFCFDAICYDEQPSTLSVMIRQLTRWCTGSYQIFFRYFGKWRRSFREKHDIKLIDNLLLLIMGPSVVLQNISAIMINLLFVLYTGELHLMQLLIIASSYLIVVVTAIAVALFFRIPLRKLMPAILTFPFFLYIYTICSAYALIFPSKKWKPIAHEGLSDEQ